MSIDDMRADYLDEVRGVAALLSSEADRISQEPTSDASEADVTLLVDSIRLWAEVLTNTYVQNAYSRSEVSGEEATWVDGETLHSVVTDVRALAVPLQTTSVAALGDQLRNVLRFSFKQSDLLDPVSGVAESAEWLKFKYSILLKLEQLDQRVMVRAVSRANQAAESSEKDAKAVARVAGKAGEDRMSSFYADLAKTEIRSADTFRRLTVAAALTAGTAALIFVMVPSGFFPMGDSTASDYVRLLQRAVFVAGVFGIAGYFARQAHQHRSMANWAASLSVQLQTFDAYIAPVENAEVKDELRKSFAARAFGDHPAMKGEPSISPSAAAMDTAIGWAAKLTAGSK